MREMYLTFRPGSLIYVVIRSPMEDMNKGTIKDVTFQTKMLFALLERTFAGLSSTLLI